MPPVVVQVTVCVPSLADTTLILTDAVTVGGENNQYNGVLTHTAVHILYTHAIIQILYILLHIVHIMSETVYNCVLT